jgi:hypothetical protein
MSIMEGECGARECCVLLRSCWMIKEVGSLDWKHLRQKYLPTNNSVIDLYCCWLQVSTSLVTLVRYLEEAVPSIRLKAWRLEDSEIRRQEAAQGFDNLVATSSVSAGKIRGHDERVACVIERVRIGVSVSFDGGKPEIRMRLRSPTTLQASKRPELSFRQDENGR